MEFIIDSLIFQKCPKSTMAANHATNYSYNNCSFCIINYFEKDKKTHKKVVLL